MRTVNRHAWGWLFALVVCCFAAPAYAAEGFTPLFDGKSLAGWSGDPALWRVADGSIVGTTEGHPLTKNSFLSTERTYKNFILRLKFKLRNHNSGVQFRSKSLPGHVVQGYQADIADNMFLGILYEEGGRGILVNVKDPAEVKKHLRDDGWNEYVITADGSHVTQVLNGYTTVDYTEQDAVGAKEGIIALQLHTGPAMQIEFRDIEIRELP